MAKSNSTKTNGHSVSALKPAAPKKPAAKAAPVKPAVKPAAKPAAKAVTAPAAKVATAPAAKAATASAAKGAAGPGAKATPGARKAGVKPAVKAAPAQPAEKQAARPAAKPALKPAAKPDGAARQAEAAPEEIKDKVRKAKLVRDSFTMPEQEYAVLGQVKKACLKAGFEIKKSELLRIGVALISQLDMATLQRVLGSLPTLKTGRPKSE